MENAVEYDLKLRVRPLQNLRRVGPDRLLKVSITPVNASGDTFCWLLKQVAIMPDAWKAVAFKSGA